jgi:hypothetical protein
MPNWQELVRQRLSGLALDAVEKDEVHTELAAHLEDAYESLLRNGICESEAAKQALWLADDWQDLRRRIQTARTRENPMSNRVTQLWLPGLLTLFAAISLLILIQFFAHNPLIVDRSDWYRVPPVLVIYIPWLLSLPLIGALGAYLSHRAGASQRVVFLSILFPVLPYLAFLIGVPAALVPDVHVAHRIMFSAFFVGLFAWVIFPGVALLVGGVLVNLLFSRRPSSQNPVIG